MIAITLFGKREVEIDHYANQTSYHFGHFRTTLMKMSRKITYLSPTQLGLVESTQQQYFANKFVTLDSQLKQLKSVSVGHNSQLCKKP